MAKRYFNVFRHQVVLLVLMIVLIAVSELTEGTISTVTKITAGAMMIYTAIMYVVWLIKAPTAKMKEENG